MLDLPANDSCSNAVPEIKLLTEFNDLRTVIMCEFVWNIKPKYSAQHRRTNDLPLKSNEFISEWQYCAKKEEWETGVDLLNEHKMKTAFQIIGECK